MNWPEIRAAYSLRWKRRRLLWRALRKRRQLRVVQNRTADIAPQDILLFATVRNELSRLEHFLDHYRRLGVDHFIMVDNASSDGTGEFLRDQNDVSLWSSAHGYKQSRFGVDWITWLQIRYAHGHWCLTVDADEILIYPYFETRPLKALTGWMDKSEIPSMGAILLDMYPKGKLSKAELVPGQSPFDQLAWFDGGNYVVQRQSPMDNLWVQGGARARHFFFDDPRRAPTLNKVPLVKWNRRFAYVSSTHSILPRALNRVYDEFGGERLSGVLLHTKFLSDVIPRSAEEKTRGEHFANSAAYDDYYEGLQADPELWCSRSSRFLGWRQLEAMGLISRGLWY